MLHTIQEAIILAGVSRRTLYNHSDAGRVAYSVGNDGRRYYETAELERAYGKLAVVAHSPAHENAQTFTPPADASELARMIEDVVARATAPLVAQLVAQVAQIADLRETLMRIEHKPDAPATAPAALQPDPQSASIPTPVATGNGQSDHSPSVSSFADLLSSFE